MNGIIKKIRLKRMIRYAMKKSSFYQKKYCGIDIRRTSIDKFPVVEQKELIKYSKQFGTSKGIYKMVSSSGTSGNPKYLFRTKHDFRISVKNQIKLMRKCNVDKHSRIAIIQPSGIWGYSSIVEEAVKKIGGFYIQIGELSDEMCLKLIKNLNIDVLDVAPSRLYRLLENDKQYNNSKYMKNISIVMSSGEKIDNNMIKKYMLNYNFRVYEQYGTEELDGLAWKNCKDGKYYFLKDYLIEILDDKGEYSDIGNLIITSLYHKGTPLIRYKLGDVVQKEGKGFYILGRNDYSIILYDSVKLSTYQIEASLEKIGMKKYINKYQIQIDNADNYTNITMVIDEDELSIDEKNILINELKKLSIDIEKLYYDDEIKFNVLLSKDNMIISKRGKKSKIIDLRANEN